MIQVEGLTKYYGAHAAIRDLTFDIDKGEVIGFLGLNGAGKSTTLRVLGCVLLPTSGKVEIDGFDVARDPHEIRKRIGFLPDTPPLYDEMTVGGYLEFVAKLRGVPSRDARARVAAVEEQTALSGAHDALISSLSHGFRQRVGLAQALVHNPALLILDEPTGGLDPQQIVEMRRLIRGLRGAHTILLSSHILSEISQTCDRLLVIQQGEIVAQGTEQELSTKMGNGAATIEVEVRAGADKVTAALRPLEGVSGLDVYRNSDGVVGVRVTAPPELRPKIVRALVAADLDVLRVDKSASQLESIFLKLTQTRELHS
jgi:ABC-2 type transport system ATP-binding protein